MQSDTKQSISDRFLSNKKLLMKIIERPLKRYKIVFCVLGNDKSNYIFI
jgi:hypothetical protein